MRRLPLDGPLEVCFPFVGDSLGGSHISSILLARGLREVSATRIRFAVHLEGELTDLLTEHGFEYHLFDTGSIPAAGKPRGFLRAARADVPVIARWLRSVRPSIVHTNDQRIHRVWGCAALAAHVPQVMHHHTLRLAGSGSLVSLLPRAVISVSDASRRGVPRFARHKVVVIDNPFDTRLPSAPRGEARRSVLEEFGIPEGSLVVATVGNLSPQKRPDVFVRSIGALRGGGLQVTGLLIGAVNHGASQDVARLVKELGLDGSVHVTGFRRDVDRLLAGIDVLVAPAVHEAFGRTLVEAMLVGTPVVAADSAGHREILRHDETGLLVAPDDHQAVAQAVGDLWRSPERASFLATRARQDARSRFSVEGHVRSVLRVYEWVQMGFVKRLISKGRLVANTRGRPRGPSSSLIL